MICFMFLRLEVITSFIEKIIFMKAKELAYLRSLPWTAILGYIPSFVVVGLETPTIVGYATLCNQIYYFTLVKIIAFINEMILFPIKSM